MIDDFLKAFAKKDLYACLTLARGFLDSYPHRQEFLILLREGIYAYSETSVAALKPLGINASIDLLEAFVQSSNTDFEIKLLRAIAARCVKKGKADPAKVYREEKAEEKHLKALAEGEKRMGAFSSQSISLESLVGDVIPHTPTKTA